MFPWLLILCLSCSATRLTSTWFDERYAGGAFKSIMIVAVTENLKNRKLFEQTFVKQLKAVGVSAVSSLAVTAPGAKQDKKTIKEAAKKVGVDAVLATHLIAVEKKTEYVPPMTYPVTYGQAYHLDNYYRTTVHYAHTPGHYIEHEYVRLENNLYETGSEKLVWSAVSETIAPESVKDVIDSLCKVVLADIRRQKLID
jgi:hypothetical protein